MVETIVVGDIMENCYIVYKNNNAIIIDPGDEAYKIIDFIENNHLTVEAILLTHGHFDHIGAVDKLYEMYHCKIYTIKETYDLLINPSLNLSSIIIKSPITFIENNHLIFKDYNVNVYKAFGHTKGDILFHFIEEGALFTGDVLFKGGIGRCDLPTSSLSCMKKSLMLISNLEFDATIYPGHGPSSTLSIEKKYNPYL